MKRRSFIKATPAREAIRSSEMGFVDLTVHDKQWLSQERILGNGWSVAARKIDDSGKHNRVAYWMREAEKGLFESWDEAGEERAESVEKVGHVG